MNLRTLLIAAALTMSASAHAESGTLSFSDFVHNANLNGSTVYNSFNFGAAWFPNPSAELRDPYLVSSSNGGSRSGRIERVDHAPFNLDSFNYSGRSDSGVAYLTLYNGSTVVYNGAVLSDEIRFKTLSPTLGVPGGQVFDVPSRTGYTGTITSFAFSFKGAGGTGFGDGSDENQFAFDDMKYSNATALPPVAPAVPEPEGWAMLLAGLGALVFKSRRNRRT